MSNPFFPVYLLAITINIDPNLATLGPFTLEMRNLVGAIQGKERLGVSPSWGRHIVEVLNACEESSRLGREVRIQSRGLEVPVAR